MRRMLMVAVALALLVPAGGAGAGEFRPGGLMVARLALKKLRQLRGKEHFGGHDANRDGGLDRKEIEQAKQQHGQFIDEDTFRKIDTDGDGKISHAECEAYSQELARAEAKEAADKGEPPAESGQDPAEAAR